MSFDEIPPVSESPQPQEDGASETAPEASATDAPSAARPRRRRAKAAETVAASEPTAPAPEKPTRAPRRRKPAVSDSPDTPPAEAIAPPAPESVSAPPAARAPRRRRAAKSAVETTEAADSVSDVPMEEAQAGAAVAETAPAAAAPITPEAVENAPTVRKPTRRSRRTTAKGAADAEAIAETPPAEPPAPPTETAAPKPKRRRAGRKREELPPTETPEASVEPAAAPEPVAEVTEGTETTEKTGRRRRAGRSRRRAVETPETTETAPEMPAASAEAAPAAEATETEEAGTGRSRRRPRRRRGDTRSERTEETDEVEPVAVAPAPPTEEELAERVDRTVGAHLVTRHGCPEIHINGVVYPPILFFGNQEDEAAKRRVLSEVRRAAHAGVHLHSTLIELPCPITESSAALDEIDDRLRAVLDADPEGFVMPRILFVPAKGWKREYPTEIATYADGASGDPSITSDRFWQEAERSLTTLITHLREYEWGKRIFGYHLERGEWFQPADTGYDRSIANRDAFRDWLREKYKHNLTALRAAWYDGDVQFHTAEIPPVVKPNPQRAFFETRRERRTIDFNEFTSESAARRIVALARTIKRASGNQALVSVCYGYTFEFGHPYSGHLALSQLLTAQAINLICGPPSYRDRKPGGAASFPAPIESPPLHGKLWLSEDDTKTYLAPAQQDPDDFNPRLGDRFATEQAQARAMGRALSSSTGVGFMDLWGEGWLDDDGLWSRIEAFQERYRAFIKQRERARTPEVVALIDEKSLLHVQRGETFFRKLTNGLRDALQRAGISYGTYLQSDLLARDFPTTAKLYLFLTPYRLTSEQRAAIKEKLQNGGKTLAWLYAPGSCEERPSVGGVMEESASGIVGFTLHPQAWNSEIGSRVLEPHHVVTERLPGREIGTRERLNPSFYVEDADATVLAEYQASGLPSLAVKDFRTWKSVFVGDPTLPLELLRGICRYAGVHLWTPQGDDITTVGHGWVTIHATRDGQRTVVLPEVTGLYDLTDSRLIADETREYRFFLRAGTTRAFCVGPTEQLHRLGLPNLSLPGAGRSRIVLDMPAPPTTSAPIAPPPRREREEVPLPTLREDLATLEAVLNVDVSKLDALTLDDLDEDVPLLIGSDLPEADEPTVAEAGLPGEVLASGRRRRRRGGRGRRRTVGGAEGQDAAEPASDFPADTSNSDIPPLPPLPDEFGDTIY